VKIPSIILAAVLFLAGTAVTASAQNDTAREESPVTDGGVQAIAQSGGTIYIGGSFSVVCPYTGGAVALDASSGVPVTGFPKVEGPVLAIAPDGSGGWYIGGAFSRVGGLYRSCLAHVDAANQVTAWDPAPNAGVTAMAAVGGTVYVAGDFTIIGGATRTRIAAIDATTGLATAWDPGADNEVLALAASGGSVYAGGYFTAIGGASRNGVAALDATTGLATAWDPNPDQAVYSLAVSGGIVYTGGTFATIGGAARIGFAALDATTGLATAWNPNANGAVFAVAVSGATVYAGGGFTTIGGAARNNVAALDATTGLATGWNPNANGQVRTLAMSGSTIYAGGSFTAVGGATRFRTAALDATTGLATAWTSHANGAVYALAADGSTVCAGGDFEGIGGAVRNRIAAFDATTGVITAWDPNANNNVLALAADGSIVYAGGDFTAIGGATRNRIAALDATTGLAGAWNPNANASVSVLVANGSTVYAAGGFSSIGGQSRNRLAALDAATASATAWNPGPSSQVRALAVSGSTIYAGGDFSSIGGQSRNFIAALDATTGLATAWNPSASANVFALAVSGGIVYAGGTFTSIGGAARNRIAALDATSGLASAWNPNASNQVRVLAVAGSTVFAGGDFGLIGGEFRHLAAALDATTGLAGPWNPGPNIGVQAMTLDGTNIYVGGTFFTIGAGRRTGFAGFELVRCTPPAIASGPASTNVCAGGTGAVSVVATGTAPLAYQWRKGGTAIPGATSSNYVISRVSVGDAGSYDVVVSNACGSATSAAATLMVTEPPVITCPPNVTVEVGSPTNPSYTGTATATGSHVTVSYSDAFVAGCGGRTGLLTRTWTATGDCGRVDCSEKITIVDTTAPVVTITGPSGGAVYAIGNAVTFTGSFTDSYGAPHAATWTFDTITQPGTVTEGAPGTVSASYTFTAAGVYRVKLTVTDACGNAGTADQIGGVDALVVVYDPSAGFVTGNGLIDSPAGAYPADPLVTGKASCGFVSKYKKGAAAPTGETQFQLRTAGLTFNSTAYEWLVVSGGRAQFKGSGMVNGTAGYGFILTAEDGAITGGTDKFRIKITGPSDVIYDNQMGDPDDAALTTGLRGGSIIINSGGKGNAPAAAGPAVENGREEALSAAIPLEYALAQNVPNPFDRSTSINFSLPERSRIHLVVYDLAGRAVRTLAEGDWGPGRHSATLSKTSGSDGTLGAGIYFVRMSAYSLASGRSFRSLRKMVLME